MIVLNRGMGTTVDGPGRRPTSKMVRQNTFGNAWFSEQPPTSEAPQRHVLQTREVRVNSVASFFNSL
jgi:hypothetical protein